jgi:hypothetical protein
MAFRCTVNNFPQKEEKHFLLGLKNTGVGKALPSEEYNIQVPVGLNTFDKKYWSVLAGTASFLKLPPLTLLPKN